MAFPKYFKLSKEVSVARQRGKPIVALESTVITHGLPRLQNLQLARDLEAIVRTEGAIPATIAVLDGRICIGLEADELERLATSSGVEALAGAVRKLSSRDLAAAVTDKTSGGTTVAATLRVAAMAGIRVFATGGIGGVHRSDGWDVSADLAELAQQPVLLVCAGAKAILDLPATLEHLETLGVPVIGYQTGEFPAFYSIESGLPTGTRIDRPEEAAALARTHWELGGGGLLLAAPPPADGALPRAEVETWIAQAQADADAQGIHGQAVSPFLLNRISELSGGRSLAANLALLRNNASIAAQVAKVLAAGKSKLV
jgi:pseudouridine-5'-phosphate glycosidase